MLPGTIDTFCICESITALQSNKWCFQACNTGGPDGVGGGTRPNEVAYQVQLTHFVLVKVLLLFKVINCAFRHAALGVLMGLVEGEGRPAEVTY